jgi:two-component system, cell cycle sensor histidine kinase PleC
MPAFLSLRSLIAVTRRVNVSTYICVAFAVTLVTPWCLFGWWVFAGRPGGGTGTGETLVTALVFRSVVVGIVGAFIVSQLRAKERLQVELLVARRLAEHASRAKSELLANTSHELRTPLNAIIGFSDMIQRGMFGPLSVRYREYAGDIFNSGTHLLNVINDILDLAKLEAGQLTIHEEEVDLSSVIHDSLRLVAAQAEKTNIELIEAANDYPLLRADGRRMRQLLINLLANAVKFTPEKGRVQVAVCATKTGLSIAVSDTGIGMRPEQIAKALEPFGQIDSKITRKYQGTGLGLPIAKHLAELHGGTLSIRSAENAGTTVTIMLPAERVLARPLPSHAAATA